MRIALIGHGGMGKEKETEPKRGATKDGELDVGSGETKTYEIRPDFENGKKFKPSPQKSGNTSPPWVRHSPDIGRFRDRLSWKRSGDRRGLIWPFHFRIGISPGLLSVSRRS